MPGRKHSLFSRIPIWLKNWNRALKSSTTIAISFVRLRRISNLWNNDHWIQFPCLGGLSLLAKRRQEGSQANQSSHWRCRKNPTGGIGNTEALKHNLSGWYSKRITQEHRMVYRVTGDMLEIISLKTHYGI